MLEAFQKPYLHSIYLVPKGYWEKNKIVLIVNNCQIKFSINKIFLLIVTKRHPFVIFSCFVVNNRKRTFRLLKIFRRFNIFPCEIWKWNAVCLIDYARKLDFLLLLLTYVCFSIYFRIFCYFFFSQIFVRLFMYLQ